MNKQTFLKATLLTQTIALLVYTYYAFQNEGANLLQIFLQNIKSLNWNGQFNLDFLCYLLLSGLWTMWRNKFSAKSIAVGLLAATLGTIVFAPYLLFLLFQEKGDIKKVLTGDR